VNLAGRLDGEFARRHEHDSLRVRFGRVDPLQQREGERGRLTGPGLGLPDQVVALEQNGNGARLDRRRAFPPGPGDRLADRLAESKFIETRGDLGFRFGFRFGYERRDGRAAFAQVRGRDGG